MTGTEGKRESNGVNNALDKAKTVCILSGIMEEVNTDENLDTYRALGEFIGLIVDGDYDLQVSGNTGELDLSTVSTDAMAQELKRRDTDDDAISVEHENDGHGPYTVVCVVTDDRREWVR